jgi:transposase-like protein
MGTSTTPTPGATQPTETIRPELVETGEQRDALGRRRTPAGRRAQLLAAYRRSGQTQREFARAEGIRYTTFCTWAQAERRRGALPPAPARGPRRAPTPTAPSAAKVPTVRFAEVDLPPGAWPAPALALEARLPDGTVLRGGPAELAALLRALRA